MTTLQTQLRNHVDECHASMGQLWVAKLFTEAANRIDALESAIEEQRLTIGALNMCIGGKDSTSLENIMRIGELEAQVAALNNALNGFIANSCRVDWPADIYDAAIAAQKGAV